MNKPQINLDDVLKQTKILPWNIKYGLKKDNLSVEKNGRRNLYPSRTVRFLPLIELRSDTNLFIQHFLRIQVQCASGRDPETIEFRERYERTRRAGRKYLQTIKSLIGSELLPSSTTRNTRCQSGRRPAQGGRALTGVCFH